MSEIQDHELDLDQEVVDFLMSGEGADLTTCDREPIHLSGASQPHGVLLAVREADLTVRFTSENSREFLGIDSASLLGKHWPGCWARSRSTGWSRRSPIRGLLVRLR